MAHVSSLIAEDIEKYLHAHEHKSLLRFITCGSVDDGKSTLIGRLLYESKMVFDDQLVALEADSKKVGTQGADLDFALLVDGLTAEREQGITIDVAYRFFSTDKRKFIVADTPGHEQYTRNMATGASTADVAVILIDARKGVLTQTCRHSYIVSLLGIKKVVLAINKMDAVGYAQGTFDTILAAYLEFAKKVGLTDIVAIPMSALKGDNVTSPSPHMPWYAGPTLMEHLESVPIDEDLQRRPFRLPVQWVARPNQDFRGFAGMIASGTVKKGDRIAVLPSAKESVVTRIVTHDGDLDVAVAGQSVTLTLEHEIDISRGDVLARVDSPPPVGDQFQATLIWMHEDALLPGRPYLMKIGSRTVTATIAAPKYKVSVNTLEHLPAKQLDLNEIGVCHVSTDRAIAFDPYTENRETGGFVLIDKLTNDTVGAGLLELALRRSDNLSWQALEVNKAARSQQNGQKACMLWFTGVSSAGSASIASLVEKRLHALGRRTYVLHEDKVREGLSKSLGSTEADRVENLRRVAEVAKLMVDAGLIVLVSSISPLRAERRMARELVLAGEFLEVFVDAPEAGKQDPTRQYEAPEHAEIRVDTAGTSAEDAAAKIVRHLESGGYLG